VTRLPPRPDGGPDAEAVVRELGRGDVAVVTVSQVSNVTGARADVRRLADAAHAAGAVLVVDGAQSVPHRPIDVQELGCDFLAFSGHKMCGPSGVGVLYGKAERLAELEWHLRAGGTVEGVTHGEPRPRQPPWRFEAGTPPIEGVVGLGAAVDYLRAVGLEEIDTHCRALRAEALRRLQGLPGARVLGGAGDEDGGGPLSFTVPGAPAHTLARGLSDRFGICVRSGHHCAEPLHESLRSPPSLRLSFYLYNQPWEIGHFFEALGRLLIAAGRGEPTNAAFRKELSVPAL
jgi:cysteine desulfurase/selenocysteine lyase